MMSNAEKFSRLLHWVIQHSQKDRLIEASELLVDMEDIDLVEHSIALHRVLTRLRMPSKRSYHLGSVITGVAGMQSSASHRVIRGREGKRWKLYVDGPDFPNGEELVGELSSNELLNEIEGLGYSISVRQWIAMGWRPSSQGHDADE